MSTLSTAWGDLPTTMSFGAQTLSPNLILAPMEGVTDLTFRRLVRQIGGCGLTVTEFIAAKNLAQKISKEMRMAAFDEDERPIYPTLRARTRGHGRWCKAHIWVRHSRP